MIDLHNELYPNEKMLWQGVPNALFRFNGTDLLYVILGICLIVFPLMMASVTQSISSSVGGMFGVPVEPASAPSVWNSWSLWAGIYAIAGRPLVWAAIRRKMIYGLTDQRLLIGQGFPFRRIEEFNLAGLDKVSMKEKRDGSGSLYFGSKRHKGLYLIATLVFFPLLLVLEITMPQQPSFEMIDNVREVRLMIREHQREKDHI